MATPSITKKASSVLDQITAGLNGEENGQQSRQLLSEGFMPLCVEHLHDSKLSKYPISIYSIAHYGMQNGDLMRDPDMEFMYFPAVLGRTHYWLPLNYRNDYVGVMTEAMWEDPSSPTGWNHDQPKLNDLIAFWNMWANNIKEQGFLTNERKAA